MKKTLGITVIASMLILNANFVFAEENVAQETTTTTSTTTTTTTTESTTATTETASTPTTIPAAVTPTIKDTDFATKLSKTYNISVTADEVATSRVNGLGYGEIGHLYGLATLSGKPVSEIAAMRQTLGWGEIAQSLGVKVSSIKNIDNADDKKEAKVTKNEIAKGKVSSDAKASSNKGNSSSSSSGKGSSSGGKGGSSGGSKGGGGSGGGGGGKGGGGHK